LNRVLTKTIALHYFDGVTNSQFTNSLFIPQHSLSSSDPIVDVVLRQLTPTISQALQSALPECYGGGKAGCTKGSAKHGYVYRKHKKWAYKVYAAHVDGINTLSTDTISLGESNDGRLQLVAHGTYPKKALATDIYVGECFTFDKCSKIWHNNDNFQGGHAVKLTLTFDCEGDGLFALTSESNVSIEIAPPLVIHESVGKIHFDVMSITAEVKKALKGLLLKEMEADIVPIPLPLKHIIPLPEKIAVTDIPNLLAKVSDGIASKCRPGKHAVLESNDS